MDRHLANAGVGMLAVLLTQGDPTLLPSRSDQRLA